VVAGRSRTRAGRPHAVSGRPMLIHTCHAMPMPRCAVAFRNRFQNGMVVTWHGRGMACVNQTRPQCVNQMGKTQSKPLTARHGRGTAWARHGMCELAFRKQRLFLIRSNEWVCRFYEQAVLEAVSYEGHCQYRD
jgi:hypothetical protein